MQRSGQNTSALDTEALTQQLARQAGAPARSPRAFPLALGATTVLALLVAVALVASLFGLRTDLPTVVTRHIFQFKVVAMATLCAGAIWLVLRCGTPGLRPRIGLTMLPAVVVLLAGVALDRSGFPLSGARSVSIPVCLLAIVIAALPGLGLLLLALRRGIPTRPVLAGAAAGVLAGALGALAYTLSCTNDGAGFVALWYLAATGITTVLGALLGKRWLRW